MGIDITALAAAAEAAEFAFDGGPDQWWIDNLASALSGLVQLPFALAFVWALDRLRLNRWVVVTAILATIFSVFATEAVNAYIWGIYLFFENFLEQIGVHRFVYMSIPNLLVCATGAVSFAWWLKLRRGNDVSKAFE